MSVVSDVAIAREPGAFVTSIRLLWHDKFAFTAAVFLLLVVLAAIFGPYVVGGDATAMNLRMRNVPPGVTHGWLYVLGGDTLGRSLLARVIVGARTTMLISASTVVCSMLIGGFLGLIAGYRGGWFALVVMRVADIIMSFPSLLMALIVLYVLGTSVANVVLVLAITRIPLYLRTSRAEVLEIRERMFVTAARVLGARPRRLVWRHIAPLVAPTMITLATLDFSFVMLAESSLSFLGLGIQPPDISWGLMVSDGRGYLATAWWLSFWPGVAITLTTMSLNLLSNWVRVATDPVQRWRLEVARKNG